MVLCCLISGKTISSRKEDLMTICDHFNLIVENPMTILSQDSARMFLANSSAKEKYQFFIKGTQLDQLESSLNQLSTNIQATEDAINTKKKVSGVLLIGST